MIIGNALKTNIMIFFCLTFWCIVRARVSVFFFCCVIEMQKFTGVHLTFDLMHARVCYYASKCK